MLEENLTMDIASVIIFFWLLSPKICTSTERSHIRFKVVEILQRQMFNKPGGNSHMKGTNLGMALPLFYPFKIPLSKQQTSKSIMRFPFYRVHTLFRDKMHFSCSLVVESSLYMSYMYNYLQFLQGFPGSAVIFQEWKVLKN